MFTLDAPIVIDASNNSQGVLGTINPVVDGLGNADLTGTILLQDLSASVTVNPANPDFSAYDVFVIDITLNAASSIIDEIGFTVGTPSFFTNPVGGGVFNDAGNQAPQSVTASLITLSALFDFKDNPSNPTPSLLLEPGDTSMRLYVINSPEGDMLTGQTVSFMVSSGLNFTVQGLIVPEPSTLVLFGVALLTLGTGMFISRSRKVF